MNFFFFYSPSYLEAGVQNYTSFLFPQNNFEKKIKKILALLLPFDYYIS